MNTKQIVSPGLIHELKTAPYYRTRDFLSKSLQVKLGLHVDQVSPVKAVEKTSEWNKWRRHWHHHKEKTKLCFDDKVYCPENFIANQKRVIASSLFCHYLATYACLKSMCVKEVVQVAEDRRIEAFCNKPVDEK